jgi:hypothetical protein
MQNVNNFRLTRLSLSMFVTCLIALLAQISTSHALVTPSWLATYYSISTPTANIPYNTFSFNSYTDIQNAFSQARAKDSSVLPQYKTLKLSPYFSQYSDELRLQILLNSERVARGLLPMERNLQLVNNIAYSHSANMAKQDIFAHNLDGKSPYNRLDANPIIKACKEYQPFVESLFWFSTSNSTFFETNKYKYVPAMALYEFIYNDQRSNWGHRMHLLSNFTNNNGSSFNEGIFGAGSFIKRIPNSKAVEYYYTINTFDPKTGCII